MKNLVLGLLVGLMIPGITMCMEHEEPPAKRIKIEVPEEEAAKFIELKRLIDTPAGPQEIVVGYIDLVDTEGFTHATFQELIEDKAHQGKLAIFAMAKTYDDTGQAKERFYDAYYLLQHLFGADYFTVQKNRYNSAIDDFKKDITTRQPIIGEIQFFAIDENNIPLFLGTDYHLHVIPESPPGQRLIKALKENIEIEALQEFYAHSLKLFSEGEREANLDYAKAIFYKPALEKLNVILSSEPPPLLKTKSQIIKGLIFVGTNELAQARNLLARGLEQEIDDVALQLKAQYWLAQMLEQGRGGDPDPARARIIYGQMAQHAGNVELPENLRLFVIIAQFNLARMLQQGEGGDSDLVAAREIYEQLAQYTIADLPQYLKYRIIEYIVLEAKYHLARMLAEGKAGEPSLIRARALYEEIVPYADNKDIPEALRSKLVEAVFYLAQMLKDGIGGEQDLVRARDLYDQVVWKIPISPFVDMQARYQLAQIYEMDKYQDLDEAQSLYAQVAEQEKKPDLSGALKYLAIEAKYKSAQILEMGIYGSPEEQLEQIEYAREDYENISKYVDDYTIPETLRLVAVEAQYKLAKMLEEGRGGPQEQHQAHELYQQVIKHIQGIDLPPNLVYLRTEAQEGADRTEIR